MTVGGKSRRARVRHQMEERSEIRARTEGAVKGRHGIQGKTKKPEKRAKGKRKSGYVWIAM